MLAGWTRRPFLTALLVLFCLAGTGYLLLSLPATTLQGVDYHVTSYRVPAYVKVTDFFQRHFQYEVLVSRICADTTSDVDCTLAIFDWTYRNIRQTPAGWPVVDDHPLHIVIRGHGKNDQIADIFTTLVVYAGVPALFTFVSEPRTKRVLPLAFARPEHEWIVFDVAQHVVFRERDGSLASIDQLVNDPELVDGQTAGILPEGLPYSAFISRETLMPFIVPPTLRPELQQPWPRLRYEVRRALGWKRR